MASRSRTLPSGRASTTSESRIRLGSVERFTITSNGRTTLQSFDADTKTWTIVSPEGRRRSIVINDIGDVDSTTDSRGITTYFSRDDHGRLIQIERAGTVQTFEYGSDGLLRAKYGPKPDDASFYGRNATGQIVKVESADGAATALTYDQFQLAAITPPGQEPHQLGWSPLGEVATYTHPGGLAETLSQTLGGRDDVTTLPSGRKITPVYDNGVLTSVQTPLCQRA